MAYDKIITVRYRLDHCLGYILNQSKTNPKLALTHGHMPQPHCELVTGINCEAAAAYTQMQATKQRWDKCGGVLGYHIIHSYAPGEVTPQEAHAAGVEFAQRLLGERFEAVVSTHLDREHYHCHIVFNSVSFVDGKKYRSDFKSYFSDLRGVSNSVSREHGLTVIEPENKGKPYAAWDAERKGQPTVTGLIQQDIDAAIRESATFGMFLSALRRYGYFVKYGAHVKHTAVKPPGGKRFFRLDHMQTGYTEADIRARLKADKQAAFQEPPGQPRPRRRYQVRPGTLLSAPKLHGFAALYVHYLYVLGVRKNNSRPAPFPVRKEVIRLKRYQRQFALIRQYRIDNGAQLAMLCDAIQARIDALAGQRKELYRDKTDRAEAQIQLINQELRQLRSSLKTCAQIEADMPRIRQQAESCMEWKQHDRKGAQNKAKNDEVDQGRSHRHFKPVR